MPTRSPHAAPALTRRAFGALAAGTAGVALVGGCGPDETRTEADPLRSLAESARRDAAEFSAADASAGSAAPALRSLGGIRRQHAERLGEEIARLDPEGARAASPTAPAATCPPVADVRTRLRDEARAARDAAASATGYRAALAASISACCLAAAEVVLA